MDQSHDPRGALVRPYAVTRGQTQPRQDIPIEAILVATPAAVVEARFAGHDRHRLAQLCEAGAQSLAELSARSRLPLGVTRVLVADLVADGLLTLHSAAPKEAFTERMDLLERVLSGRRRL